MYRKIVAREFGGPEVLQVEEIGALPVPGPGEARIRVEAAGVGYTDTILRRGRYLAYTGGLPATPGYDVVGVVDTLGEGVSDLVVGQRVADMPVAGAYSQYLVRAARDLVPVPDGVDPGIAVEVPLMGMTAWQMLTRSARLAAGDSVLVVGASGSVGRALVALARHMGLRVVGTCSAKHRAQVEGLGAVAIDYRSPDLLAEIRQASSGEGVAAAFDAIGGASWMTSFRALRPGGTLVGYGLQDFIESGDASARAAKEIRRFTRLLPWIGRRDGSGRTTTFYDINQRRQALPDEYRQDALQVLGLIASGDYKPEIPEILPLSAAAESHRRVAAGGLDHRLVLDPWMN